MGKIRRLLKDLPPIAPQGSSLDRGSELSAGAIAGKNLVHKLVLAIPRSPWQKGRLKNTNRKGSDGGSRKRDIRQTT